MNLNQITVPALDVGEALAFYRQLGLQLIVDALPRYVRLVCPDGGSSLSVHQVDEEHRGHGPVIYFECADLDERVARLKAAGLEFSLDPTDQSWLWREARLRDPYGNEVILYFAGENRLNPPWRVKADA